ncbi:hypothetical protein HDE_11103 [Halotydeus destructor]|nr:hypothetical protein HDE_11103 [Halotydeus destructor]
MAEAIKRTYSDMCPNEKSELEPVAGPSSGSSATSGLDEIRLKVLNEVTKKRRTRAPLTDDEVKLDKIVERRRESRRRWNRRYLERTGRRITMMAIDRVKRMKSENDELDTNLGHMLTTVKQLKEKFLNKLAVREKGLQDGLIDPEEPTGKEHERQMRQWLLVVPSLLQHYEEKKDADMSADRDLNNLTTVFNYIDQGNNAGASGALPVPKRVLPAVVEPAVEYDVVDSDEEDEDEQSSEEEVDGDEDMNSDDDDLSSDCDSDDSSESDSEDE